LKARVSQTFQDTGPGAEIDKSADSRFYLWDAAIKMTEQSPIFGMGFDQFHRLSPSYTAIPIEATDNQNMFLYAASNMGIPSLALLLGILFLFFFRAYKIYNKSSTEPEKVIALGAMSLVPGYIVVNMFGTHMIDPSVSMFFWVYCAIIIAIKFPDKKIESFDGRASG
jgi:O-antigen ligase